MVFRFVLLHFVSCYLLEAHSFLLKDRKGVDSKGRRGGEELGGVKGGKTISVYVI